MTQTQKKYHVPMYQNSETKNKNPIKKYCSGEHKNPMIVLSKGQKNVKSFCNEMRAAYNHHILVFRVSNTNPRKKYVVSKKKKPPPYS
jgi:serine kinase of HPr protein (carbohydrate metabolism regulator)